MSKHDAKSSRRRRSLQSSMNTDQYFEACDTDTATHVSVSVPASFITQRRYSEPSRIQFGHHLRSTVSDAAIDDKVKPFVGESRVAGSDIKRDDAPPKSLSEIPWSSSLMKVGLSSDKQVVRTLRVLSKNTKVAAGNVNTPLFPSNVIRTSKYTALSFLPLNLFEQFRRVANVYFMVIILVSLIPDVAPFAWWTSAAPLAFILSISAAKDGYEDYQRHKEDNKANECLFICVRNGTLVGVPSGEIAVGDVLQLFEGQELPADLILLSTSKADMTCYTTTASLDGEATPKLRTSPQFGEQCLYETPELISSLKGSVVRSGPVNKRLEGFEGVLELPSGDAFPLGDRQVLLRGSKLTSTNFAFGIVFATGPETKLMLNRNSIRFKFSSFERVLNQCVIASFLIEITICLCMAISAHYEEIIWDDLAYTSSINYLFSDFGTHFVLFSFMIPVSLFVTIDFVKVGQAKLIEWDFDMSIPKDTVSSSSSPDLDISADRDFAFVKSSNLTDELGQIEFVFSDKTGTLTENRMELSEISVDGMLISNTRLPKHSHTQSPPSLDDSLCSNDRAIVLDGTEPKLRSSTQCYNNAQVLHRLIDWCFLESSSSNEKTHHLQADYYASHSISGFNTTSKDLLFCLLLCNDVITESKVDGSLSYVTSSPDEVALVDALARNGIVLEESGPSVPFKARVLRSNTILCFKRIAVLEFSSDRRRMTVVIEAPDGTTRVYTKGASSVIETMVKRQAENKLIVVNTRKHLKHFAQQGCRTLMMACRVLSVCERDAFMRAFEEASLSLVKREKAVERAFQLIECDMNLVGCSAVEDQLQDGVPETVEHLLRAGIRIMILTGDMQETAITIGRSSRVIAAEANLLMLNASNTPQCRFKLEEYLKKARVAKHESKTLAMVLNGNTLEIAVTSCSELFLALFNLCQTIICNRATPAQKAMVVALVKARLQSVCLAIGDGANDVSMIRKAHVGVGLTGKEGRQAAQSADFVLHRFQHLRRLLFVHGRYSYLRSSRVVLFSFYKNFFYSLPLFFFAFFSAFSGQSMFDSMIMTMFNMFFTSWPPLLVGVLEKDVLEPALLKHPEAFRQLRDGKPFSLLRFIFWLCMGTYQAAVLFFIAYFWFDASEVASSDGLILGLWSFGAWIQTSALIVVNVSFILLSTNVTGANMAGSLLGFLLYACFFIAYSMFGATIGPEAIGLATSVFTYPSSYLYNFVSFVFAIVPILIANHMYKRFWPTFADVLRADCSLAQVGWPQLTHTQQTTKLDTTKCCSSDHLRAQTHPAPVVRVGA